MLAPLFPSPLQSVHPQGIFPFSEKPLQFITSFNKFFTLSTPHHPNFSSNKMDSASHLVDLRHQQLPYCVFCVQLLYIRTKTSPLPPMFESSLCRFSIKQPPTIVSPIFPVHLNFLSFLTFASNSFPKVSWHHSFLLRHPTSLLSLFYVFSIFSAAKLACLFLLSPYPLPLILLFLSLKSSMLPSLKLYPP